MDLHSTPVRRGNRRERKGRIVTLSSLAKSVKTHGRLRGAFVAALAAAVLATMILPARPSEAGPGSGSTAIVSLGDSFISGEAGRWQGNSLNMFGTRDGTDRAASCTWWGWCTYDASRVYGSSASNGCHRSDVATIKSAAISVSEKINLACSGAKSVNIWRASQGGQSFKGEAPQADQLLTVAQQKDVKLVVLTILANDVGFADHVINCASSWVLGLGPCNSAEQASLQAEAGNSPRLECGSEHCRSRRPASAFCLAARLPIARLRIARARPGLIPGPPGIRSTPGYEEVAFDFGAHELTVFQEHRARCRRRR